jgi:hypothetical protein
MFKLPLRFLRMALAGSALILMTTAPSSIATASLARPTRSLTTAAHAGKASTGTRAVGHVHLNVPSQGTHFLYVDNGLGPDSISGFQITSSGLTPTPGSPYPTGGSEYLYGFGQNQIAVSSANGPCLFHTDLSGQVESFTINASTGALTQVTSFLIGGSRTSLWPGDIHISANGLYAYVALWGPPSYIVAFTIGSGCTLNYASNTKNANAAFLSLTLVGNNGLMAVDAQNSQLDIYGITNGTQLKLVTTTPSQLYHPAGAATTGVPPATMQVFTAGDGVQAYTVSLQGALTAEGGSPAEDPCWCTTYNMFYDPSYNQLTASEQGSLGIYSLSGSAITFQSQVPLASGDDAPSAMTELDSDLYVLNSLSNTVDVCTLAAGSATCSLAATLPNGGYPQGIGVF